MSTYNIITGRLKNAQVDPDKAFNHIVTGADSVYDDVAPYRTNGHIDCTAVTPVGTENPVELRWYERVNYGTEQEPLYDWIRSQDTTVDNQKTYGIPNGAKQSDINNQLYEMAGDIDKVILYANEYEQVVSPAQDANPYANGWYYNSAGTGQTPVYVLATETSIDNSHLPYYVRIARISPDENNIINQEEGYIPTAGAVGRALGANFEDNLTSTSTVKGLTANQGRVLNEKKADKNGWYEQFVAGASLSVIGDDVDNKAKFFYRETGDSEDTGGSKHIVEKGTATINEISGNTVKFNQVLQDGDFSQSPTQWSLRAAGTITVSDNTLSVTLTDIDNVNYLGIRRSITGGVANHTYYVRLYAKPSKACQVSISLFGSNMGSVNQGGIQLNSGTLTAGVWNKLAWLATPSSINPSPNIYFRPVNGTFANNDVWEYRNIIVLDLTTIGIDNLTTTAEVEAWLTQNLGYQDYYPYNTGSLINLKPKKLISTGFNRWDEEWTNGYYVDGVYTEGINVCSVNYIKVLPNTNYYFKQETTTQNGIVCYDINKNFIRLISKQSNTSFTTPDNCRYIQFYLSSGYGRVYNHDICIHIYDITKNNIYIPALRSTVDLSWIMDIPDPNDNTKKLFPYGLLSAGSVHDEVRGNKVIKRLGSVDLGSLSWGASTDNRFYADMPNDSATPVTNGIVSICSIYNRATATPIQDKEFIVNSNALTTSKRIFIKDTSHSTAPTSSDNWLNGVMLNYELDTPIEVTFEEPYTHPMNYEVEPGGTEEFVKANAALGENEPTSTSLTATITYPLDLLGTIRNLQNNFTTLGALGSAFTSLVNVLNSMLTDLEITKRFSVTGSEDYPSTYTFGYAEPESSNSVENESI